MADGILHGGAQLFAVETGKIVVGEILDLQLVRLADETGGAGRGDHGIGEFPDLADRDP